MTSLSQQVKHKIFEKKFHQKLEQMQSERARKDPKKEKK
jgi:hypothetical protein